MVFYWVIQMTCQGCEARRKWMKEQYERSRERMRLCIERLTSKANRTEQSVANESKQINRAKQSAHSDQL